jgi:hypothetical protein
VQGTNRWVVQGNTMLDVVNIHTGGGSATPLPRYGINPIYNGTTTKHTESGGIAAFNGDGTTTVFAIATDLVDTPTQLSVTPHGSAVTGAWYCYLAGSTINVVFTVAPVAGTGNVKMAWMARV